MLQARVGDGVGAEVRGRGLELRCTVTPTAPVRTVLGVFLLNYHKDGLRLVTIVNAIARVARWARPSWCRLFVELPKLGRTLHRDANCIPEQGIESFDPEYLAREHVPKLREIDSATVFKSSE